MRSLWFVLLSSGAFTPAAMGQPVDHHHHHHHAPQEAAPEELRTAELPPTHGGQRATLVTPDGSTLAWRLVDGVKVGHLIAEELEQELAPGLKVKVWGYNGAAPGPTIEAIEGDRLRIYVSNRLPTPTTVHWHGLILPNGMDGVAGLTQAPIPAGETFVYEFVARHAGTFMYHPHYDEMTQMALGMAGMFIVHPRREPGPPVARDFVLLAQEWRVPVGQARPDPNEMSDFNVLTFNGRAFPKTSALRVRRGERVRIRIGNLSPTDHHPIHLHGLNFVVTGTDGGPVPKSAQFPETTVLVPVGSTRVIELVATEAGDWPIHCHMTHHAMTQMGHGLPVMIGADSQALQAALQKVAPGAMVMGTHGMGEMSEMEMPFPTNSAPMRGGRGRHGAIDMGGMFTVLSVRDVDSQENSDRWYVQPVQTVSGPASPKQLARDGVTGPNDAPRVNSERDE